MLYEVITHRFFARYLEQYPLSALADVDRQYHRIRYAGGTGDLKHFKNAVRAFIRESNPLSSICRRLFADVRRTIEVHVTTEALFM